jgi:hypothetical protein
MGQPHRPRPMDAVTATPRYQPIYNNLQRSHHPYGMMCTQLTLLGGTLKNRATLPVVILLAAAALTACTSTDGSKDTDSKPSTPATTAAATPSVDQGAAEKAAGIPPVPTGADREALLRALKAANPAIVSDEDKAIDAARNQCAAINGGAQKLDWTASQRFTYKDVTTTEAQGKQINEALKGLGFCKV